MRRMHAFLSALGCLLFAASLQARAEALSYSYMELSAAYAELNANDNNFTPAEAEGSGGSLAFSLALGPRLYAEARYSHYDLDKIDVDEATVRIGAHHRFINTPEKFDVYGGFSIDYLGLDNTQVNDPGIGGYLGLRYAPGPRVEFGVEASLSDMENGAFGREFNAQLNATERLGIRASVRALDDSAVSSDGLPVDITTFRLGLRYMFNG